MKTWIHEDVDRRNKCGDDGGKLIVIASREAAWQVGRIKAKPDPPDGDLHTADYAFG